MQTTQLIIVAESFLQKSNNRKFMYKTYYVMLSTIRKNYTERLTEIVPV